jgi:hypothetical protein
MDDTMASNEVAKDTRLGSLVPLNSWTRDLKVLNPSSIVCLCLVVVVGWGFMHLGVLVWVFIVSGFHLNNIYCNLINLIDEEYMIEEKMLIPSRRMMK